MKEDKFECSCGSDDFKLVILFEGNFEIKQFDCICSKCGKRKVLCYCKGD